MPIRFENSAFSSLSYKPRIEEIGSKNDMKDDMSTRKKEVKLGRLVLGKRPGIVSVIGEDPVEMAKASKWLGADLLELRLDMLRFSSYEEMEKVIGKMKSDTGLPCIATNRIHSEGGKWEGTEAARVELLEKAVKFVDAVDIELITEAPLRDRLIRTVKDAGKVVIVSSHSFFSTPSIDEMKDILVRSSDAGADISKLAVMPCSLQDTLNLLQVTLDADMPLCTISMGDAGKHTRLVASCYGSVLTYGSVGKALAPGQLSLHQLHAAREILF